MSLAEQAIKHWNEGSPSKAYKTLVVLRAQHPGQAWCDLLLDAKPPREMIGALVRVGPGDAPATYVVTLVNPDRS